MDWAVRLRVRFASRLARNWLGLNRPRSAKATRQVWLKPEPGLLVWYVCFERFLSSLVGWSISRGFGTGFGHMAAHSL